MPNKTYTAPAVCAAAGINPSTLRTWRHPRRGGKPLLAVEKEHERGWTLYSETDALRVCVFARLVRSGVEPKLASALTDGLVGKGAFEKMIDGKPLFAVVSEIGLNIDDRKKPDGPSYTVLWNPSLPLLLKETKSRSNDDDSIWQILDLAKIRRNAMRALKEAI